MNRAGGNGWAECTAGVSGRCGNIQYGVIGRLRLRHGRRESDDSPWIQRPRVRHCLHDWCPLPPFLSLSLPLAHPTPSSQRKEAIMGPGNQCFAPLTATCFTHAIFIQKWGSDAAQTWTMPSHCAPSSACLDHVRYLHCSSYWTRRFWSKRRSCLRVSLKPHEVLGMRFLSQALGPSR